MAEEKNPTTEKKPAEKPKKEKSPSRVKKFIRDYKSEIKKISWPSKKQVVQNTGVVLAVILAMSAVIGVLDGAFYYLLQLLSKI